MWGGPEWISIPLASADESARARSPTSCSFRCARTKWQFGTERHTWRGWYDATSIEATVKPIRWRVNGTYLVTGGLGGLGLAVATWMAEQGARRILLTARNGIPPRVDWPQALQSGGRVARQIAAVQRLETLGADVRIVALDVGDEPRMREFLQSYRREGWPPIRGVVHAAGVVEPKPLTEVRPEDIDVTLRAKVTGALVLDRLLGDVAHDFFILFSSAAAVMSSPSMGVYSAGNAFLDALAHHRRGRGQHALAIDWGPWADVGMAADYGTDRGPLDLKGMRAIDARVGLSLMEKFVAKDLTQVAVLPVDWSRWRDAYPSFSRAPVYDEVYRLRAASIVPTPGSLAAEPQDARAVIAAAAPEARLGLVEAFLKDEVARSLNIAANELDSGAPLLALGLDSLMVIEVRSWIKTTFGVVVRLMELLGGASIAEVAGKIMSGVSAA